MRSKLFAILLIVCLLLTVVACTDPENKNNEVDTADFEGTTPVEEPTDSVPDDGFQAEGTMPVGTPIDPTPDDNSQTGNQGDIQIGEIETDTEFGEIHTIPPQ